VHLLLEICHVLQVPHRVLTVCAELMTQNTMAAEEGLHTAGMLMLQAFANMSSRTGNASGSSSSSSGSGLTAMLWEQIEQSGFLQQLPGQLSKESDLLSRLCFQPSNRTGMLVSVTPVNLLMLMP
jgi:hypothetical protein